MNKAELVQAIAHKANLSKSVAQVFVETFEDVIAEQLSKGEQVSIQGFGVFCVKERAGRKGFNPQTKEEIIIPATKAPVFKAGKFLKETVKG